MHNLLQSCLTCLRQPWILTPERPQSQWLAGFILQRDILQDFGQICLRMRDAEPGIPVEMRWSGASKKLSLIYRNIPFILLLSDFSKFQGHLLFPSTVKKMKLRQTRVSSGNEIKHFPCCWCRTDVTAAADGPKSSEPTLSPAVPWTALSVQVDFPTQPRDQRGSSCKIPDVLLVELDNAWGDSACDLFMQVSLTTPRNH